MLESNILNIPEDAALPVTNTVMPYVFVGDEAYTLLDHLLKPYARKNLDTNSEYFNSRLSRARRVIECAFGILNAKWRILWKSIELEAHIVDDIIKCVCILH